MIRRSWVVALAVPLLLLSGCSYASSGAPPTVVCGTTIWSAAAGAVVQDVSSGGTVHTVSAGLNLFLRVSKGCGEGASVSIRPSEAATITKVARAQDGRIAAAVIQPHQTRFRVVLRRADGTTKTVRVELGPLPLPTTTRSPSTP